jgi:hexosaminidase
LIIPEIEVPGHASASIYAYPWLGASSRITGKPVYGDLYQVADPKVEGFLHDVLDEIVSLFPGKIIHIGGDEANYKHWKNSVEINAFMKANKIPTYTDLQVWAINRMSKYISSKGYRMIGWNEITGDNIRGEAHVEASQSEKLAPGTIVQFWDGEVSLINKAIEKGYEVVNSNRFFTYLDYPYNVTSMEKAYSFNPVPEGIAEKDRNKILGLGAQMWGEVTPDESWIDYFTFPRLAVFAENGWVNPAKKQSYKEFRERFVPIENIWKEKGYIKKQIGKY